MFTGRPFGATDKRSPWLSTGITGYQETLTDPSYHRQISHRAADRQHRLERRGPESRGERIWVAGLARCATCRARPTGATGTLEDELIRQRSRTPARHLGRGAHPQPRVDEGGGVLRRGAAELADLIAQ